MASKILFTEDALADLETILDYIRERNPEAANRFGSSLLDHVETLATFPRMGAIVPKRSGVRKIVHRRFRFITACTRLVDRSKFFIFGMARGTSLAICRPS